MTAISTTLHQKILVCGMLVSSREERYSILFHCDVVLNMLAVVVVGVGDTCEWWPLVMVNVRATLSNTDKATRKGSKMREREDRES